MLAALERAYADGSWGRYHGPHTLELAAALAERFGVEYVSLCCSGTFAVQLALRALGVGRGDEVVLAAYDFPGNFRSIEAVGGVPVLVDIAVHNWNLDPSRLQEAIGPKTRAILVSHLHGGLAPMREIVAFACERGLRVVEDACQAPGAIVEGRPAGTWGDAGVLSFGGSKLLTAGRGGAVLTRHADAHQRAKVFCEQGNHAYPLSELQAAVLVPQLAALGVRNEQRAHSVEIISKVLAGARGIERLENRLNGSRPVYYKLGFKYDAQSLAGASRADFITEVQANGVALDAGFRGFVRRGVRRCRHAGSLDEAARASECALVLHHPILLESEQMVRRAAETVVAVARAVGERER